MRGAMRYGGRGIGPRPYFKKQFIPHVPFDLHLTGPVFQKVSPHWDDSEFAAALQKKNQDLTPSEEEHQALLNLVNKVQTVLLQIIADPKGTDSFQIEETRQVGSFKKETMLAGDKIADFAIRLKTLPTEEAVMQLGQKILDDLRSADASDEVTLSKDPCGFTINCQRTSCGVRCYITTIFANMRKLEPDLHLPQRLVLIYSAAILHSRWFEFNGQKQPSVKILIRLIRDLRNRFEGFLPLNPWMVDILCHYALINTFDNAPLSLADGYKRVLQLLACAFFTPGSCGIRDPCELNVTRLHTAMTVEEQDIVCMTAQNLVRHLLHGNYKAVLGDSERGEAIERDTCIFNGVVISPLGVAYEKPQDKAEEDLEESDAEPDEEGMQTE